MVSQPKYPLVENREGLKAIRDQMLGLMTRYGLRGLAAPQVGTLLQLAVVRLDDGTILDLVNPVITQMYGPEAEYLETCISCPPRGNGCKVARIQVIHLKTGNLDNTEIADLRFKATEARIIQHEMDHLEGTFFFQRAKIKDGTEIVRRFNQWRHEWQQNQKKQGAKDMATISGIPPRPKKAVPDVSPLEAGDLACGACGKILKREVVVGPRNVEEVKYTCINEETGCRYEIHRKLPAQNVTTTTIKA